MRLAKKCALALGLLAAAGTAHADALDDWATAVDRIVADLGRPGALNEYDKGFGERVKKSGRLLFVDEEYSVLKGAFGGGAWEIPEKPVKLNDRAVSDAQLYARWKPPAKDGRSPHVLAVVVKFPHKDKAGKPAPKTRIGDAEIVNTDAMALVQAFFKQWTASLVEQPAPPAADGASPSAPPKADPADPAKPAAAEPATKTPEDVKSWAEPKRKAVGLAKFYAAAQGTVQGSARRERREWYAWADDKATYVVFVRIDADFLMPNHEGLSKGSRFVESIKKYS